MGSSSSKAAKTAGSTATRRKYPSRIPPTPNATSPSATAPANTERAAPGPTVHPPPSASESKDESVSLDARDPDFAASLRSLGPVQPNSTLSNTSTFRATPSASIFSEKLQSSDPSPQGLNIFPHRANNPALAMLEARNQIAAEAEKEFTKARVGGQDRRFLDVGMIRQILSLRDEKCMRGEDIERKLGLAHGVVNALAAVEEASMGKRDKDDAGLYD